MGKNTIRLTMAQALVKYLCNQYILIDDKKEQLYAGVFGIFGHGNVTCFKSYLRLQVRWRVGGRGSQRTRGTDFGLLYPPPFCTAATIA